eukprot:g11437.t1
MSIRRNAAALDRPNALHAKRDATRCTKPWTRAVRPPVVEVPWLEHSFAVICLDRDADQQLRAEQFTTVLLPGPADENAVKDPWQNDEPRPSKTSRQRSCVERTPTSGVTIRVLNPAVIAHGMNFFWRRAHLMRSETGGLPLAAVHANGVEPKDYFLRDRGLWYLDDFTERFGEAPRFFTYVHPRGLSLAEDFEEECGLLPFMCCEAYFGWAEKLEVLGGKTWDLPCGCGLGRHCAQTSRTSDMQVCCEPRVVGARKKFGPLQVSGRYHHLPRKISDDYILSETILGSGFGGNVILATSRRIPGRRFAVKSIKLFGKPKVRRTLAAEVEVFLSVDHPHVCRLLDVYESHDRIDLVMEALEGGELYDRVNRGKFSEKDAADATYQMLLAIRYLHSLGIVHRDIKLENFLYDEKGSNHLKLIDFGFSKAWDPEVNQKKMKMSCGTICYVAPEVILQSYTHMCDLWSLGVVVFLLLVGYMPFPMRPEMEEMERDILNANFRYDAAKWSKVSPSSYDFVSKLLKRDPEQRMTAEQALAHPWIVQREQMASGTDSTGLDASVVTSLAKYAQASKFRRTGTCLQVMAWSLSNTEMAEVRHAFMELDADKKGTIQLHELKNVLEERFNITDEETKKIFQALDASNHEEVKYSEFLAAMMSSRIEIHEDLVRTAFKRFDTDNSGFITVEELRQILGESLESEEQAAAILAEVPQFVDDNKLSYDEFIEYLISGEAQESFKEVASLVIDKQISMMSSDQIAHLPAAPLEPKHCDEIRYHRAKSFGATFIREDSDEKGLPPVAPLRTAPAKAAIQETTETLEDAQGDSQVRSQVQQEKIDAERLCLSFAALHKALGVPRLAFWRSSAMRWSRHQAAPTVVGVRLSHPRTPPRSAALHRIAKAADHYQVKGDDRLRSLASKATRELVKWDKLKKPQTMSKIVWAMAKLNLKLHKLVAQVSEEALQKLPEFEPQQLVNLIWSYATLRTEELPLRQLAALDGRIAELAPLGRTNLAWAVAKLQVQSWSIQELVCECRNSVPEMNGQNLANTSWAFATLREADEDFFNAVAKVVRAQCQENLSNMAWAYAKVQIKRPEMMEAISESVQRVVNDMPAQGVANTVWSFATLNIRDDALMRGPHAALLGQTRERIETRSSVTGAFQDEVQQVRSQIRSVLGQEDDDACSEWFDGTMSEILGQQWQRVSAFSSSSRQLYAEELNQRVLGRHVVPHVGDHVVVLDPSGSRSATGTVMEVRCEGGRVRVEHDGVDRVERYYNTGKDGEFQLALASPMPSLTDGASRPRLPRPPSKVELKAETVPALFVSNQATVSTNSVQRPRYSEIRRTCSVRFLKEPACFGLSHGPTLQAVPLRCVVTSPPPALAGGLLLVVVSWRDSNKDQVWKPFWEVKTCSAWHGWLCFARCSVDYRSPSVCSAVSSAAARPRYSELRKARQAALGETQATVEVASEDAGGPSRLTPRPRSRQLGRLDLFFFQASRSPVRSVADPCGNARDAVKTPVFEQAEPASGAAQALQVPVLHVTPVTQAQEAPGARSNERSPEVLELLKRLEKLEGATMSLTTQLKDLKVSQSFETCEKLCLSWQDESRRQLEAGKEQLRHYLHEETPRCICAEICQQLEKVDRQISAKVETCEKLCQSWKDESRRQFEASEELLRQYLRDETLRCICAGIRQQLEQVERRISAKASERLIEPKISVPLESEEPEQEYETPSAEEPPFYLAGAELADSELSLQTIGSIARRVSASLGGRPATGPPASSSQRVLAKLTDRGRRTPRASTYAEAEGAELRLRTGDGTPGAHETLCLSSVGNPRSCQPKNASLSTSGMASRSGPERKSAAARSAHAVRTARPVPCAERWRRRTSASTTRSETEPPCPWDDEEEPLTPQDDGVPRSRQSHAWHVDREGRLIF